MKKLLRYLFYSWLFLQITFNNFNLVQATEIEPIIKKLEKILNNKNTSEIETVVSKEIAKDISQRYDKFVSNYSDAKWLINKSKKLSDNRESIEIIITGNKETPSHKYYLVSNQRFAITIKKNKIIKRELLSDSSILRSDNNKLNLIINIPNVVLEKPLEDPIIAGGLIALKNNSDDDIELIPMESGGIFKSARAPLTPGIQRWGALIVHPDGLISISKMVRVVSSQKDLIP